MLALHSHILLLFYGLCGRSDLQFNKRHEYRLRKPAFEHFGDHILIMPSVWLLPNFYASKLVVDNSIIKRSDLLTWSGGFRVVCLLVRLDDQLKPAVSSIQNQFVSVFEVTFEV